MAENLGQAVLELDTRDRKFTRGVNQAERLAKNLDRQFIRVSESIDRLGSKLQGLGKKLAIGITAPIVAIGVASVKTASDIQELNNLTQVTFGESTKAVLQWSRQIGAAVGRTSFRLQEAATQFAAFLKPLGAAPEQIVPMSEALALLTTDISSFRNLSEEQVFVRLFSGLSGEAEAVRRLGIDMSELGIQQELLNLGFTGSVQTATQAQKVIARFNIIVRQSRDAQGDAARTGQFFENRMRTMQDSIREVRLEIGQQLLPVALKLVNRILQLTQGFLRLTPKIQGQVILYGTLAAVIGPVLIALGSLIRIIGFAIGGLAKLARAFTFLLSPILLIPLAIGAVTAALLVFGPAVVDFARNLIKALEKELVAAFNNKIVRPFQKSVNGLIGILKPKLREDLGIQPIVVNDIIGNDFTSDFKATMEQAKKDAASAFDDLKLNAKRAISDVKSLLTNIVPEGGMLPGLGTIPPLPQTVDLPLTPVIVTAERLPDLLGNISDETGRLDNAFAQMGATFTSAFEDAILSGERFSNVLGALLKDIARLILRSAILDPLSSAISGGITSFFGGLGGRTHGGRVQAGQSVFVNEGRKQQEIFRPDSAGRIFPSSGSGGGDVILQIDASGADPSVLANLMRLVEARIIPQAIEGARSAVFNDFTRPEFA